MIARLLPLALVWNVLFFALSHVPAPAAEPTPQPRPTLTPIIYATSAPGYAPGVIVFPLPPTPTPGGYPGPQERQQAAPAITAEWIAPGRARVSWNSPGAVYRRPAGTSIYIWLARGAGGTFELPLPPPVDQAYQPQAGDTYGLVLDSDGMTMAATLPQPPYPPTQTPSPYPTLTPTPRPMPYRVVLPIIAR